MSLGQACLCVTDDVSFLVGCIVGVNQRLCPPGVLGHLRPHSWENANASLHLSEVVLEGLAMAFGSGELGLVTFMEVRLCSPLDVGRNHRGNSVIVQLKKSFPAPGTSLRLNLGLVKWHPLLRVASMGPFGLCELDNVHVPSVPRCEFDRCLFLHHGPKVALPKGDVLWHCSCSTG